MLTIGFLLDIDRFSMAMAARTTKTALIVGLVYGGLQDLAGAARGRRVGYIDSLRQRLHGEGSNIEKRAQ